LWFDAGCAREASASNQQGKRMKHGRLPGLILMAMLASAGAATAQTVTVGATSSTSDAPIYIADKKGFFRQEGIDVTVSNFRSASDMVAPLAPAISTRARARPARRSTMRSRAASGSRSWPTRRPRRRAMGRPRSWCAAT